MEGEFLCAFCVWDTQLCPPCSITEFCWCSPEFPLSGAPCCQVNKSGCQLHVCCKKLGQKPPVSWMCCDRRSFCLYILNSSGSVGNNQTSGDTMSLLICLLLLCFHAYVGWWFHTSAWCTPCSFRFLALLRYAYLDSGQNEPTVTRDQSTTIKPQYLCQEGFWMSLRSGLMTPL